MKTKPSKRIFCDFYKNHNIAETSKKFSLSVGTIFNIAKEYGLTRRTQRRKDPPKQEFIDFYENHTALETVKHFGLYDKTHVSNIARKYEIPRRSFKYKELPNELTSRQIEIINGSLLGDGCIEKLDTSKSNCRFIEKHGIKQLEYLEWKRKELKPFAPEVKFGSEKDNWTGEIRNFCKMQTFKNPIFTKLESKWYNSSRVKIIPSDLILTPLTIAIWYFDDGFNDNAEYIQKIYYKHKRKNIWIYTNGFQLGEVEKLIEKLKNLGILNCYVKDSGDKRGNQPQVYIGASSYFDFIDMITPYLPCECMKYKTRKQRD